MTRARHGLIVKGTRAGDRDPIHTLATFATPALPWPPFIRTPIYASPVPVGWSHHYSVTVLAKYILVDWKTHEEPWNYLEKYENQLKPWNYLQKPRKKPKTMKLPWKIMKTNQKTWKLTKKHEIILKKHGNYLDKPWKPVKTKKNYETWTLPMLPHSG